MVRCVLFTREFFLLGSLGCKHDCIKISCLKKPYFSLHFSYRTLNIFTTVEFEMKFWLRSLISSFPPYLSWTKMASLFAVKTRYSMVSYGESSANLPNWSLLMQETRIPAELMTLLRSFWTHQFRRCSLALLSINLARGLRYSFSVARLSCGSITKRVR